MARAKQAGHFFIVNPCGFRITDVMFTDTANPVKILFELQEQFRSAQADHSKNGGIPKPLAPLILPENHPRYVPTYDLYEGSLRHYPLRLEGVRLGDKLRAHFECYALEMDYPVSIRMERGLMRKEEKMLRLFPIEPVATWNLIQVRAGMAFRDLVPSGRHGLHFDLIDSFHENRKSLEDALQRWMPDLLDRKLEV